MASASDFNAAMAANLMSWNGIIPFLLSIVASLIASWAFSWGQRDAMPVTPASGTRLLGYLLSVLVFTLASFGVASVAGMGQIPPMLIATSATLIGLPFTLMLDRFPWVLERFGGDTIGESFALGWVGTCYGNFATTCLWAVLSQVLR